MLLLGALSGRSMPNWPHHLQIEPCFVEKDKVGVWLALEPEMMGIILVVDDCLGTVVPLVFDMQALECHMHPIFQCMPNGLEQHVSGVVEVFIELLPELKQRSTWSAPKESNEMGNMIIIELWMPHRATSPAWFHCSLLFIPLPHRIQCRIRMYKPLCHPWQWLTLQYSIHNLLLFSLCKCVVLWHFRKYLHGSNNVWTTDDESMSPQTLQQWVHTV